jgi:hypothetical protein
MRDIFDAIETYAKAYTELENLQRSRVKELPRGDQKTGVIAEFYARIYAEVVFAGARLVFGHPSEPVSDIVVHRKSGATLKIQVKAVSAHADKGRVSPIHPGWDELWLMRLTCDLAPEGFWVIEKANVDWANEKIASSTMPQRNGGGAGSARFRTARDEFEAMRRAVEAARLRQACRPLAQ